MRIYTKTGDKGETGTFRGRMSKGDILADALGNLDELNSWIGLCRELLDDVNLSGKLGEFQKNLLSIGSKLAGYKHSKSVDVVGVGIEDVERLEKLIDGINAGLPKIANFILPTGSGVAAYLQVARAVARRAERSIVRCGLSGFENDFAYLNRLSDVLFVIARSVNIKLGGKEEIWKRV